MKKIIDYIVSLRQYETIIASILVLIVVGLLSFVFLLPNFIRAKQIFDQHQVLKKRVEVLRRKDETLSNIDVQYFKDVFTKLTQVIPDGKDYVSLFSTLDSLESKTGVTILRTDVQLGIISTSSAKLQRAPNSSAFMLPVTIEVIGGLDEVKKFLVALKDLSGRLLTVENVQLSMKGNNIFQAAFSGRSYFFPSPVGIGALDSLIPEVSQKNEILLDEISKIKVAEIPVYENVSVGKKNLFQ